MVFREIGFDSKPISEIGYMEEPHLKMTIGGRNTCNKGRETTTIRGGSQVRQTICL